MNRIMEFIEDLGRTPVIPLLGFPGLRMTGRTILEGVTSARAQFLAVEQNALAFQPDALIHIMDLTVEAGSLGAVIRFPENDPPSVLEHTLKLPEQLDLVHPADPQKDGRMNVFIETVRLMKKNFDVPVGAYVIGPYTLAGEMMKVENTLRATIKDPDYLHRVLSRMTEAIIPYARALVHAGADILTILEPTASMLSPSQFRDFSGRYVKDIFHSSESAMTVLHICGDTTRILPEMAATGADGLSVDSAVKLDQAAEDLPGSVIIGNIDPVRVILNGSPETVSERTMELRVAMKDHPNFILSTGCDLPPDTPSKNILAFMEAGRANF